VCTASSLCIKVWSEERKLQCILCALLVLCVTGFEVQNVISWENCGWSGVYGATVLFIAECSTSV